MWHWTIKILSPDTSVESLQIFQFGNYSVKRRFRGINDDDVPSHHTLICNVVTKSILNTFKATYCQCNKKCDQSLLLRSLYIYKRQKLIIWWVFLNKNRFDGSFTFNDNKHSFNILILIYKGRNDS